MVLMRTERRETRLENPRYLRRKGICPKPKMHPWGRYQGASCWYTSDSVVQHGETIERSRRTKAMGMMKYGSIYDDSSKEMEWVRKRTKQ